MLVCGIDIGTTNLKVGLFDEANRLVWLRTEPTPRARDALGPVTNADALARLIEAMIVDGWRQCGKGRPIGSISTTGVGEDGIYVDAAMEPLGPAIPWFDLRARPEAQELAADIAATPRAGIAMDPTRAAPKWLWTTRNLPDQVKDARTWICLTDYPLAKWAAVPFMSDTLASRTGCFDPLARQWIAPLLAASGATVMPPILSAGGVIGPMRSATLLGTGAVDANTLLVAGGHDHPVAAHAIHRLSADARVDSLGTANVIYGDAPAFAVDHFDPWIAFMASIEGPQKLACLGVFEFTAVVNQFSGGMEAVRRVMALPQLPGGPGDLVEEHFSTERQLLEWATLNARQMLERLRGYGVPEGPVFATGGWSRSKALLELRASIFGQPICVPEERELSVLGAALFAAKAIGGSTQFETPITTIEPNEAWRTHYADVFAQFTEKRGQAQAASR